MHDAPQKPIIKAQHISKSFNIPLDRVSDLKQKIVGFAKHKKGYRHFMALDDVSFEINKGDFFGIVGRNGSGKSTLLKILAGIYTPDKGKVHIGGTMMTFIELGVGFNPNLSARENVYLNGAMIGFSRKEVEAMYNDIVDFAELHDFMEEKLKNFSSGMKVRLAFSIAIRTPSEILLLDEVLAVGDKAFRDKCNDFFKKEKGKRTIVLVSHDMNAIEQFCDNALLLDKSKIVKISDSAEIASLYNDMFAKEKTDKFGKNNSQAQAEPRYEVKLDSVKVLQKNKVTDNVEADDDFKVQVALDSPQEYSNVLVAIKLMNKQNLPLLMAGTSRISKEGIKLKKGRNLVEFTIQNVYTDDDYNISIKVADLARDELLLFQQSKAHEFLIQGRVVNKNSLVHPNFEVTVT